MNFTVPTTSIKVITIVVIAVATGAIVGLFTLSVCLLWNIKPENGLLTAFVSLTGQFSGTLTGLLINTRSSPGTDADLPKGTIVSDHQTTVVSDKPTT